MKYGKWKPLPDAENSDGLLAKEEGVGVLHLDFVVLPVTVNSVVLEHICLLNTQLLVRPLSQTDPSFLANNTVYKLFCFVLFFILPCSQW